LLEAITALAYCKDKDILISGSYDKSIKIWSVATKELIGTLNQAHDGSYLICFLIE
jgi:WD domain, G-beta repeat.